MNDDQKQGFYNLLDATMSVYRAEASASTKTIWWNLLREYPIEDVTVSFSAHLRSSRFAPVPADIIGAITKAAPCDGRPGADEAWALLPRSERDSAAMTGEMVTGLAIAQPLLDAGDEVAARMAFRESYNRLVGEARSRGEAAHWFVSMGRDPVGREVAQEALKRRAAALPRTTPSKLLDAPTRPVDDLAHEIYVPLRLRLAAQ